MHSVLIIEDYESIQGLYASAFKRANFSVTTASSGYEGLIATAKRQFDVIILDLLMLNLGGNDFLKEFVPAKHPQTIVMVVSNLDSQHVIEKAKSLGASDYLIKSQFTPDELVRLVQERLSNRQPSRHENKR